MYKVYQHFLLLFCFLFTLTNSSTSFSCIKNTPCQCLLDKHSFTIINCSYSLPDLPILNSNISRNITKITAQNALSHWPLQLCKYINIQTLDLSGSHFKFQTIDFLCLSKLISLNLSYSQIEKIPNFLQIPLKNLQILDLSNNQIEILNGSLFRLLNNLQILYLQNNPLKQIDYFGHILSLSNLKFMNLTTSSINVTMKKSLTTNEWIYLAHKWKNSNKSLTIHTNIISLQSIFPKTDQFQLIPLDSMKIIFRILSNSIFRNINSISKCNCIQLRNYQRVFSFSNNNPNLSLLYQSSTCSMPNGILHVSLFDRRTLTDLQCYPLGRLINQNLCSLLNPHLFIYIILLYLIIIKKMG
ncbi:unnamed protein product [Adineta steineri]|uniref:Uncharacterized protein n=1 Tax=Adineta steineri TaxID=433720 RepID=A0A814XTC9_9BILA|nr:unnamed protein product [Adineta steineri]